MVSHRINNNVRNSGHFEVELNLIWAIKHDSILFDLIKPRRVIRVPQSCNGSNGESFDV